MGGRGGGAALFTGRNQNEVSYIISILAVYTCVNRMIRAYTMRASMGLQLTVDAGPRLITQTACSAFASRRAPRTAGVAPDSGGNFVCFSVCLFVFLGRVLNHNGLPPHFFSRHQNNTITARCSLSISVFNFFFKCLKSEAAGCRRVGGAADSQECAAGHEA